MEPEKPVYNIPERKRNAYGDFIVTTIKVKDKEIPKENQEAQSGSDEDEDSSEEEEQEPMKEFEKEEVQSKCLTA